MKYQEEDFLMSKPIILYVNKPQLKSLNLFDEIVLLKL